MWDARRLAKLLNIWEERWQGSSQKNHDLKIIYYDNALRITSGSYTQSKKIEQKNLTSGYWYYQANAVTLEKENPRILILGFGGGTIGTLLKQKYPRSIIDGVEIDPVMIELGERFLGLKTEGFNIVNGDAIEFVSQNKNQYDYICVDLYIEDIVSKEVETKAFYEKLKESLTPMGKVSINRIYQRDKGEEAAYQRYLELLSEVFSQVKVVSIPNQLVSRNYIFVGKR